MESNQDLKSLRVRAVENNEISPLENLPESKIEETEEFSEIEVEES